MVTDLAHQYIFTGVYTSLKQIPKKLYSELDNESSDYRITWYYGRQFISPHNKFNIENWK